MGIYGNIRVLFVKIKGFFFIFCGLIQSLDIKIDGLHPVAPTSFSGIFLWHISLEYFSEIFLRGRSLPEESLPERLHSETNQKWKTERNKAQ